MGAEGRAFLGDKEKMKALAAKIESFGYTAEISTDEEHSVQKLIYRQGSQIARLVGYQQLSSPEYQRLLALHKAIGEMDQPPFMVEAESTMQRLKDRQAIDRSHHGDRQERSADSALQGSWVK